MDKANDPVCCIKCIRSTFFKTDKPVLLKGYLKKPDIFEKWKCIGWSTIDWKKLLGAKSYPIQFGKKIHSSHIQDEPQWEHLNVKGSMTYENFLKWEKGEITFFTTECNSHISSKDFWGYIDYYYMKNLPDCTVADEVISWDVFGFPEFKAEDSTIWIGSKGANTPCHIDTYASNIICQIYGKKRWTLFPKEQTEYLYPTRVPYEESSIYSEVAFPNPNIKKVPKFILSTPYCLILEPGDVLFIPKHWWHFVENLEFAISMNMWVPRSNDYEDRLKESLVFHNIGSLCQSISDTDLLRRIYNANMIDIVGMDSGELLSSLKLRILNYLKEFKHNLKNSDLKKYDTQLEMCSDHSSTENLYLHPVKQYSFNEYWLFLNREINLDNNISVNSSGLDFNNEYEIIKLLINTFSDDRVLEVFKTVLAEKVHSN